MYYYTIYKITNTVNNNIYIGKHKTTDLDDGYMGSGCIIKHAIEKYGIDKFTKEILYIFDNEEQMNNMEKEIVNDEFILREDVYNLKKGGDKGWWDGNLDKHNNKHNYRKTGNYGWKSRPIIDEEFCKKVSDAMIEYFKHNHANFTNKTHTEETKRKIGEANKIKQKGNLNSQFGKCWIYNENQEENKNIKKEELQNWLDKGWIRGRKMKYKNKA